MFKRYNAKLLKRVTELQERGYYSLREAISYRKRQDKLKALRPKLKVLEKRLQSRTTVAENALSVEGADGSVRFNADKLFDLLDEDGNGELSYEELNQILKLSAVSLVQFTRRMNHAAGESPDAQAVTRSVFIRFFLEALETAQNFEPTPEEAGELYDEIAQQAVLENGEIPHRYFYTGPLSEFLTDAQINDLLMRFHRIKMMEGDDENMAPTQARDFSGSFTGRASARKPGNRYSVRSSVFGGKLGTPRTISREEFIQRYPQLLLEVTTGADDSNATPKEKEGVDLAFEDLSLELKLNKQKIKVVNNVTGRLPSGTMTALMGGSGAGKTSLLNALCGRAFYGEVSGVIKINGHVGSIEEHSDVVGFVPQVRTYPWLDFDRVAVLRCF